MVPLLAQIGPDTGEARRSRRRVLRLQVPAAASGELAAAHILNLSEEGLLAQTEAKVGLGETLDVFLPEAGKVAATVVWVRDGFFGCTFEKRIATSVVSAALLRSPPRLPELKVGQIMPLEQAGHLHLTQPPLWDERSFAGDQTSASEALVVGLLVLALLLACLFTWSLLTVPFSVT